MGIEPGSLDLHLTTELKCIIHLDVYHVLITQTQCIYRIIFKDSFQSEPLRTLQIPSAIYHTSPVNDDKCAVSLYDIQQECRGILFICNVDQVPSFSNLISDLIYLSNIVIYVYIDISFILFIYMSWTWNHMM